MWREKDHIVKEFWFIFAVLHNLSMKAVKMSIAEMPTELLCQIKFSTNFTHSNFGFLCPESKRLIEEWRWLILVPNEYMKN